MLFWLPGLVANVDLYYRDILPPGNRNSQIYRNLLLSGRRQLKLMLSMQK